MQYEKGSVSGLRSVFLCVFGYRKPCLGGADEGIGSGVSLSSFRDVFLFSYYFGGFAVGFVLGFGVGLEFGVSNRVSLLHTRGRDVGFVLALLVSC